VPRQARQDHATIEHPFSFHERRALPLTAGARVGPYELLSRIGAGGMGEVFRGRDTRLDRLVAIKLLSPAPDVTPKQLERFHLEARAISRVSHPNICALYDVGQQDGVPFLVMELLEGQTLANRLESGPMPIDRALEIGAQIADALDAAHGHGITHRDLKPGNIMVTREGVKLLDFGIAKLRDADEGAAQTTESISLTDEGAMIGTLPYMAPEQLEGREADWRADIFALGAVLFEMTTGRRPFQGVSRASHCAAILTENPPLVSTLLPTASPAVDRIIRTCLAKDPDERWQSARDLASELRWVRERSRQDATGPPRFRRPSRQALAVAALAGVVTGAAGLWMLRGHAPLAATGASVPRFTQLTFRAGTLTSARFAPDGQTIVYSAAWQGQTQALYMVRQGNVESRPLGIENAKLLGISSSSELAFLRASHFSVVYPSPGTLTRVSLTGGAPRGVLDDVVGADWIPGTSDLAVVRSNRVEFPAGRTIYETVRGLAGGRVAPGGDRIVVREHGDIVVLDRAGRKKVLSTGGATIGGLGWSPKGDEVWFAAAIDTLRPTLKAVSMSGAVRVLFQTPPGVWDFADVLPDGRVLAVHQYLTGDIACLPPGESRLRDLGWLSGSIPVALSTDGRLLLIGEWYANVTYLRKTDGSDAVRLADGYPLDLSRDGRFALVNFKGPERWLLVPTGPGTPKPVPPGVFDQADDPYFLPDDKRIVFSAAEKGKTSRLYVQTLADGTLRAISPDGVRTTGGLPTPDGRSVWGRSNGAGTIYPVDGGALRSLPFVASDDRPVQWSPDGKLLYVRPVNAWPPVIERIDVITGKREPWLKVVPSDPVGFDNVFRVQLTPDGRSYCFDYGRLLSTLFLVEGLK
jgi:hypothetical protein